jgi:broad specificity phosphatase PhoE
MRHGQTAHNSQGKFQGRIDAPLDGRGVAQAGAVAAAISRGAFGRNIDVICTSPLVRAALTADIVGEAMGMDAIRLEELMEIDCGKVSGMGITEARIKYPEVMDRFSGGWWDTPYPGGQSHKLYESENVLPAIRRIVDLWEGKTVLAVTHGGFIRTAVLNFLGLGKLRPFLRQRLDNCSLTTIEVSRVLPDATAEGRLIEFNLDLIQAGSGVMDVYSKEVAIR